MKLAFFDIEVYPNYCLVSILERGFGEKSIFLAKTKAKNFALYNGKSIGERSDLADLLKVYTLIGFNNKNYDNIILSAFLSGANNEKIYKLSQAIISGDKFYNSSQQLDTIDIEPVLPAVKVGLKMYGARIHFNNLQNLPYPPEQPINKKQIEIIKEYCLNDVLLTAKLFEKNKNLFNLRHQLGREFSLNFYSSSNAQIAEAIFRDKLNITNGIKVPKGITYKAPDIIKFKTPALIELKKQFENQTYGLTSTGAVDLGELTGKTVTVGYKAYSVGLGGLHSNEKAIQIAPDTYDNLVDVDVASYYPSMMLNFKFAPAHTGDKFLSTFKKLVDDRLTAKKNKQSLKSDALKIVINGTFGKLGNKYSALYSPQTLIQTTITGQLLLLLLIEMFEANSISCFSANTDGLVLYYDDSNQSKFDEVFAKWQELTKLTLEKTIYKAYYAKDVNNYFAIDIAGNYKRKGIFAKAGLTKSPQADICLDAVEKFLVDGVPLIDTLTASDDIRGFLFARNVSGGAIADDKEFGKVVRWYWSSKGVDIKYTKSRNKVPNAECVEVCQRMPGDLPSNIDYQRYEEHCLKILKWLGYDPTNKLSIF